MAKLEAQKSIERIPNRLFNAKTCSLITKSKVNLHFIPLKTVSYSYVSSSTKSVSYSLDTTKSTIINS